MKLLIVMLCLVKFCNGLSNEDVKKFIEDHRLDSLAKSPFSLPNISLSCKEAINRTTPMEAAKYVDNTGKPASGFMDGNLQWLGNYGACIKMDSAHYCYSQLYIQIKSTPVPMSWGLCVPKECDEHDITHGLDWIMYELQTLAYTIIHKPIPAVFRSFGADQKAVCYKESKYTAGTIITLTIISLFIALCTVGTCWDMMESLCPTTDSAHDDSVTNGELGVKQTNNGFSPQTISSADSAVLLSNDQNPSVQIAYPNKNAMIKKVMLSFSLIKNTDQIMSTKVLPNSITCINGMRVISMFWVILGHVFIFDLYTGIVDNTMDAYKVVQKFTFLAVDNAFVSVDSFFFLSGLLVGYLSFRRMDKNNGRLPILGFYFHRYWRLTPGLMFVILFYDKMIGFLGKGPAWFNMQADATVAPCDKYWWTNLLYINNFHPKSLGDECVGWSWYLANDMQFYVISPLIIIIIYKFKWIGAAISIGSMTLMSIIVTIAIMAYYDLSALTFSPDAASHPKKSLQYSDYVYIKPYCRITPYLVGMFLGYVLHRKFVIFSKFPRKMSWIFNAVGWFVAAAVAVAIIYGPYSEYREGGKPFTKAENVLYGGFFRCIWGVILAWVTYACHNGYGGQVNRFLSARYWTPLSRLTYGAYLLHPIVLTVFFFSFETPIHITLRMSAFYFISCTALSYGAAFILAIFVELPLANLEKLFFKF